MPGKTDRTDVRISMKDKIKVVLVDDHTIFREGLSFLLTKNDEVDVVGEASDGKEAVEMVIRKNPDIVIMDVSMPEMSGLEATARIRDLMPKVKILILSMYNNQQYIDKAFANGAAGYVLKDAAGSELLQAIKVVNRDETYLSPALTSRLVKKYVSMQKSPSDMENTGKHHLTPREREILKLLAMGKTNREISEELFISIKTVETHRKNIMSKLKLRNLADIVRYAIKQGIISV